MNFREMYIEEGRNRLGTTWFRDVNTRRTARRMLDDVVGFLVIVGTALPHAHTR